MRKEIRPRKQLSAIITTSRKCVLGLGIHETLAESSCEIRFCGTEFIANSFQKRNPRGSVVKNERRSPLPSVCRMVFQSAKYDLQMMTAQTPLKQREIATARLYGCHLSILPSHFTLQNFWIMSLEHERYRLKQLLPFAIELSCQSNFDELTPLANQRRASGSPG